jgi:cytochrome bd-type quinol oxidase subunit 1
MKWTLILRLSLIGLVLAVGSVYFISPNLEPLLWLGVFFYYAYGIGNGTRTLRFWHGLLLGILSSLWVVAAHEVFLTPYLAGHPREVAMIAMVHQAGLAASPRAIMSFTGTFTGFLEGIVIGVFAIVAGMMVRPKPIELATEPEVPEPGTDA